jgi:Domain of unknown function (DUF1844)
MLPGSLPVPPAVGLFQAFFSSEGNKMAPEEQKQEGKGFTVQDRRRFSETGEARAEAEEPRQPAAEGSTASAAASDAEAQAPREQLAEINFSTFVISLSTQALMHLGEMANPLSGKVEKDVAAAKQMIDILGMLREKTRGNLDGGEEKLIGDILFDLRMRYVEAVRKK